MARSINFEGEHQNNATIVALTFIKNTLDSQKQLTRIKESSFPMGCVPNNLKSCLYVTSIVKNDDDSTKTIKKLSSQKYEFMIYSNIDNQLDSGKIVVNDSINFKSFKYDLIDDETWAHKEDILKKLNNPVLNTPIKQQLEEFKKQLDPLILSVNERIKSGDNKELKIKSNGEWTLPYVK